MSKLTTPPYQINPGYQYYKFDENVFNKNYPKSTPVAEIAHPKYNVPMALFRQEEPDLSKGHKEFFGIFQVPLQGYFITGFDRKEVLKITKTNGLYCKNCHDVIYSKGQHDFVRCKCEESFVDGGNTYMRYGFGPLGSETVTVDLFRKTVKFENGKKQKSSKKNS